MTASKTKNYRKTQLAFYLGFITQAICAIFLPLLYVTFNKTYGISLGKLAALSTTYFFTQLITDAICPKVADKIGYRMSVIISEITSGLGLLGLAFLPDLLPDHFIGILICVIVYAVGADVLCFHLYAIPVNIAAIIPGMPVPKKSVFMPLRQKTSNTPMIAAGRTFPSLSSHPGIFLSPLNNTNIMPRKA